MSAKREKRLRQHNRRVYEAAMEDWRRYEPPKWRIIKHRLWKRKMPNEKDYI